MKYKGKILKLREEGKSYKQIVKEIGCSLSTVSYHCGEEQRNKSKARNKQNNQKLTLCICGGKKATQSVVCNKCRLKSKRELLLNKTIEDVASSAKNQHKFVVVRRVARDVMKEAGIEKKCKLCDFTFLVETCHIKPISEFDKDAKLSEVNALKNLVYLCPNHHVLFDSGMIDL